MRESPESLKEEARDSIRLFINRDNTELAKFRSIPEVKYTLSHRCDICKNYWTTTEWFIMTHKFSEHGIPIPRDHKT